MTPDNGESTEKPVREASKKRRRRVVFVEYDITDMNDAQFLALLLALASNRQASFHVEIDVEP